MKIHYFFTVLVLAASFNVLAGSKHDESHGHQHDAHVHGVAELTLAVEGSVLEIGIESPSANIVGFEHKANTTEQRQAVDKAKQVLENPSQLFVFSGTSCQLKELAVDMKGVMHTEEKAGDHHHNHEKDGHHDHHKDHDKHEEKGETHSEITANYHFSCDNTADLTSVSVELFALFPSIEKINAKWITASQQGAQTLTAEKYTVQLK